GTDEPAQTPPGRDEPDSQSASSETPASTPTGPATPPAASPAGGPSTNTAASAAAPASARPRRNVLVRTFVSIDGLQVQGRWTAPNGALVCALEPISQLRIPHTPFGNYRLEATVARQ